MNLPNQVVAPQTQDRSNCRLPYSAAAAASCTKDASQALQVGAVTDGLANCNIEGEKPRPSNATTTFQWKVDVPDFVPRWMINNSRNNRATANVTPCGVRPNVQCSTPDRLNYCLLELDGWLNHLYMEPGKFDLIAEQLLSIMNSIYLTDAELATVVDRIVKTATLYTHFGYQAARLCSYLNQHYARYLANRTLFRQHLLQRCMIEHQKRFSATSSPDTMSRFYNFNLFLAELIVHFRVDDMPVEILMRSMLEVLQELVDSGDEPNVRCAISALKCCGALLNSYSPMEMRMLFDKLDICLKGNRLSPETVMLLQGLYNFRQEWDRTKLEEMSAQAARCTAEMSANYVLEHDQDQGSAVFYGPDGKPLSAEESAFLAEIDQSSGDEDATNVIMNGSVSDDDIIAEAYEEFLQMQKGI